MLRQKDMEESFQLNHGDFSTNLHASLDELDRDIKEAEEIDSICTNEWCVAIERDIDDLHNAVYMICEPRFADDTESKKIRALRNRLHALYERYKGVQQRVIH